MKTLEELDACYRAMPPVAAMGIESTGWDGQRLRLRAPLAFVQYDDGRAALGVCPICAMAMPPPRPATPPHDFVA